MKDRTARKPLPSAALKNFKEFAQAYSDEIVRKWIDYFVLHKQVECEKVERKIK